jgi:hypothetical protein
MVSNLYLYNDKKTQCLSALPSTTRAAVSAMVEANGALPDDTRVRQFDETAADAMDWIEEDEAGISAEGGEFNDAVRAAYDHIILPCVLFFSHNSVSYLPRKQMVAMPSHFREDRLRKLYRHWDESMPFLADAYLRRKHGLVQDTSSCNSQSSVFIVSAVETHGKFC